MTKDLAGNRSQTKYYLLPVCITSFLGASRVNESSCCKLQSLYAYHNNPQAPLQFQNLLASPLPQSYTHLIHSQYNKPMREKALMDEF